MKNSKSKPESKIVTALAVLSDADLDAVVGGNGTVGAPVGTIVTPITGTIVGPGWISVNNTCRRV